MSYAKKKIALLYIPLASIEMVEINQLLLKIFVVLSLVFISWASPRKSLPVGLFQQTAGGQRILLLRSIHCCRSLREKWVEFRVLVGPVCIKTSFLWSNMLICDRGRAWNN